VQVAAPLSNQQPDKNWQNSYNSHSRLSGSGTPTLLNNAEATGAGAEGIITYGGSGSGDEKALPVEPDDRYKKVDFDSVQNLSGVGSQPIPNYRFCRQGTPCWPAGSPQPPDVITYPFTYNSKFDAELMQSVASSQGNYVEMAGGGGGTSADITIDASNFNQITSPLSSVFMVRLTGAPGLTQIVSSGSPDDCGLKGTILVINGNVRTANSGGRCFDGVISIQDPNNLGNLEYRNIGNFTLNGFTNIEGTATIAGTVDPHILDDIINHPGFHELKLWSWRECYDTQASTGCAP